MLGVAAVGINLCGKKSFGVPITAPITPFSMKDMRDTFVRMSFKTLSKREMSVQNLKGSDLSEQE